MQDQPSPAGLCQCGCGQPAPTGRWPSERRRFILGHQHYRPVEERLWSNVNKNGPVPSHRPDLGPCWLWVPGPRSSRYGEITIDKRKVFVHRVAYELCVGPIPPGLVIDHLCRNNVCVNPTHLEPVTIRENTLRGIGPTAQQARQTHCKRGHELAGDNLRVYRGMRQCKECSRMRQRLRRGRAHFNPEAE